VGEAVSTGSLALHSNFPLAQATGNAGTYASVLAGTSFIFIFRDPLRSCVRFIANPTHATYSYTADFWQNNTVGSTFQLPANSDGDKFPIPFRMWTATTTLTPHGQYLYSGTTNSDTSVDLVWLDVGATVTFTQATAAAFDKLAVSFYNGSELAPLGEVQFSAGGVAVVTNSGTLTMAQANNGGYFAFAYVKVAATTAQTVSAVLSGSGDVWAHLSLPNVFDHISALTQARVVASSLLITNVASELNKEGKIYGAQFPMRKLWTDAVSTDFTTVQTSFQGAAATGLYTYLRPSSQNEMEFHEYFESTKGAIRATNYFVDGPGVYVAAQIVTAGVGGAYPGLDFNVNLASVLEFVTDDQWYEHEFPMASQVDTFAALDLLTKVDPFMENPLHMRDIYAALRSGGRLIRKHAAKIGGALSVLFPGQAAIFSAIASQLQN